ncbi:MAG: phosphate/phosphonate ABC transporter permease [Alphaproteobacteria bacterium]|nr:phosphate/phosphonate ABC transporter permease [Alphaproteobacteria bacterium]
MLSLENSRRKDDQLKIARELTRNPIWRLPILSFPYIFLVPALFFVILLIKETEVSYSGIIDGLPVAKELFIDLLNPNWKLLPKAITLYAKQTVEIALLGTIIAFCISLPMSLCCSWNLMNKNYITKSIYYPARAIVVTIRAIPTFLLGLIFVALVGLGPFPGVLAIIVFSCGIMIKLFSEAIENLDAGLMESVYASGGTGLHNIKFVVLPQSISAIIAQTLYCTEINVHSATVLGLIGAEGIGLPIHEYLTSLSYHNASTFIIVTIAMTIIIDYSSSFIRNNILLK